MDRLTVAGRCVLGALLIALPVLAVQADADCSWMKPGENVEAGQVYLKIAAAESPLKIEVRRGVAVTGIPSLDAVADMFGVYRIEKAFVLPKWVMDNPKAPDLNRVYIIYFSEQFGLSDIINAYQDCPEVEFAEFVSLNKLFYEPDDPRFRGQWHLTHCGFPAAWDVSRGSDDVVIGIVDSGIDMDAHDNHDMTIHEDLEANLWINWGEDFTGDGRIDLDDWNGCDDDENGYPDDFYGWDFTGRDNWPNDEWGVEGGHGSHVAGIVSAVTDNGTGVASAGFGCKLMITGNYARNNPDNIQNGYQGITYCASNGADIINISWGSDSRSNRVERDVIQFALGEGCAIFAGVGNDTTYDSFQRQTHFYPAAYHGVIGVGASNENDRKAYFSNWGDYTDLVAPGVSILSCWPHNTYRSTQGTSMSSPLAAGLGALMLSTVPELTADELLERMQLTGVDIQERNEDYPGIRYRINADYLLNSTHPHFELDDWSIEEWDGDHDGRVEPCEHILIHMTVSNHSGFADGHNVTFTLENDDPYIMLQRAQGNLGFIGSGSRRVVWNNEVPIFYVRWNSPPHYTTFTLTLNSDEGFASRFQLPLTVGQPLYLLVDDDDGTNYETYYISDFDELGLVYDLWSIADDGPLEIDRMGDYCFVVWETGTARQPLSQAEQDLLAGYLNRGGRSLLLSSQYIGDDNGDGRFFRDYLHAQHGDDSTGDPQLSGVGGHPITDGMSLLMIGGSGANDNQSPSSMEALDGAQAIFTYNRSGQVAGLYWANDTYQVIYLGFALEAASGLGGTTTRAEFLDHALGHFYAVEVEETSPERVPVDYSLEAPHPDPFNSTVTIGVSVPENGDYSLEVLDISGRLVDVLHRGYGTAGVYKLSWNAGRSPAGVYLFRLCWKGGSRLRKAVLVK